MFYVNLRYDFIFYKIATLNNYVVGDEISLIDDDNKVYTYKINGIVKNYLMHYIYIDKELYDYYKSKGY